MNDLLKTEQIENFRQKASVLEHPKELVVDLLRAVQDANGWVPDAGITLIADILGNATFPEDEFVCSPHLDLQALLVLDADRIPLRALLHSHLLQRPRHNHRRSPPG